jgi:hypothetical protein
MGKMRHIYPQRLADHRYTSNKSQLLRHMWHIEKNKLMEVSGTDPGDGEGRSVPVHVKLSCGERKVPDGQLPTH